MHSMNATYHSMNFSTFQQYGINGQAQAGSSIIYSLHSDTSADKRVVIDEFTAYRDNTPADCYF